MANGIFFMHFPMRWRNKWILSCDMKRHWLVEVAKQEDGQ
jgi:hypothetical protein